MKPTNETDVIKQPEAIARGSLQQHGSMPLVINLSPRESECAACGKWLVDCRQGIPMYEGEPVPHDWTGEWVGRDVCIECFYAYTGAQAVEKNLREWWKTVRQRVASNSVYTPNDSYNEQPDLGKKH